MPATQATRLFARRPKVRWLGNKRKREFHRIVVGVPQDRRCRLDEIQAELSTRTARELREQGYDPCSFCTRKFTSKENT